MKLKDLKIPSIEEILLEILKSSVFPISIREIEERMKEYSASITEQRIKRAIRSLEKEGYDINLVISGKDTKYSLVREGRRFKMMGKVRTPFIASSDFHIGSKGFSEQAFKELVKCTKKEKVKDIVSVGDLIQGLGVYSVEAMDVLEPSISKQIDSLVEHLREFPKEVKIHISIGGHEEKLKGKWAIGLDPLKAASQRLPNVLYYGAAMNLLLNDRWSVLGLHSSGVSSYAGYRVQSIYRNLQDPRPNLLIIGHSHRLYTLSIPPETLLIESGCLQRESSYLLNKGYTSQVGWVLVRKFERGYIEASYVKPVIY